MCFGVYSYKFFVCDIATAFINVHQNIDEPVKTSLLYIVQHS